MRAVPFLGLSPATRTTSALAPQADETSSPQRRWLQSVLFGQSFLGQPFCLKAQAALCEGPPSQSGWGGRVELDPRDERAPP